MDNKSLASDILKVFKHAENIISKAESGEGLNLSEEQKQDFKNKLKETDFQKMKIKLEEEKIKLQETIKKMK